MDTRPKIRNGESALNLRQLPLTPNLSNRILQLEKSGANKRLDKILAIGLVVACFFIRPSHLGEDWSVFGSTAILAIGVFTIAVAGVNRIRLKLNLYLASAVILLWIFLAAHAAANGVAVPYPLFAMVLISSSTLGAALALASPSVNEKYFRYLSNFLCVMGLSSGLTIAIALFVPIERLYLFTISNHSYSDSGGIYLPFTMIYVTGTGVFHGEVYRGIPRANMFFREAGIAQAFYCWAIVSIDEYRSKSSRVRLVALLIGLMSAQSTAGFLVACVAISLRALSSSSFSVGKIAVAVIVIAPTISAIAAYSLYDNSVGLVSKMNTTSYSDRSFAMEDGVREFLENPIGYGIYNSPDSSLNSGINLIASAGAVGIIGIFLIVITWGTAVLISRKRIRKLAAISPFILSALFAQPLIDAGWIYIMFLCMTSTGAGWPPHGHQAAIGGQPTS